MCPEALNRIKVDQRDTRKDGNLSVVAQNPPPIAEKELIRAKAVRGSRIVAKKIHATQADNSCAISSNENSVPV